MDYGKEINKKNESHARVQIFSIIIFSFALTHDYAPQYPSFSNDEHLSRLLCIYFARYDTHHFFFKATTISHLKQRWRVLIGIQWRCRLSSHDDFFIYVRCLSTRRCFVRHIDPGKVDRQHQAITFKQHSLSFLLCSLYWP